AMETRRIDSGHRIARGNLSRSDVRRGVDRKVEWNRQLREIDIVALEHDVLPCRLLHRFAWDVLLAALAKRCRQIGCIHAQTRCKQTAIAGDIGDYGHREAFDVFIHHDRTLAGVFELEHERRDVELASHRNVNAQQLIGKIAFDHREKAAKALPFAFDTADHASPFTASSGCTADFYLTR